MLARRRTTRRLLPLRLVTGATPARARKCVIVPGAQGLRGFREDRGDDVIPDPGQGAKDCNVTRLAAGRMLPRFRFPGDRDGSGRSGSIECGEERTRPGITVPALAIEQAELLDEHGDVQPCGISHTGRDMHPRACGAR